MKTSSLCLGTIRVSVRGTANMHVVHLAISSSIFLFFDGTPSVVNRNNKFATKQIKCFTSFQIDHTT